jgi:hypothetical protein
MVDVFWETGKSSSPPDVVANNSGVNNGVKMYLMMTDYAEANLLAITLSARG